MSNNIITYENCSSLLVTGAAGFIGSHLVDYIIQTYSPTTLVVVDSLTYCGNRDNINSQAIFECANICDETAMMNILIKYRIDGILHLAAESDVTRSYENPYLFLETNIRGTLSLLECVRKINHSSIQLNQIHESNQSIENKSNMNIICCNIGSRRGDISVRVQNTKQKIKKFLFCSTDEIYGTAYEIKHTEKTTLPNPTNPYSASKAAAEMYCFAYLHSYKLPIVISRMNNVYGINQHHEKVIPKFVKRLSQGLLPQLQGSGLQKRTFLHSTDAAKGLFTVFREGKVGEVYNIGADKEITIRELAERIVNIINEYAVTKFELIFPFIENRPMNDFSYDLSIEKIEKELGWKAEIQFEDGLEEVVKALYRQYTSN